MTGPPEGVHGGPSLRWFGGLRRNAQLEVLQAPRGRVIAHCGAHDVLNPPPKHTQGRSRARAGTHPHVHAHAQGALPVTSRTPQRSAPPLAAAATHASFGDEAIMCRVPQALV